MVNSKNRGIRFALLTAFISGVSIFINKFAVTAIGEPLVFTAVKNTGVALIILTYLLSSGKIKEIKKLNKNQLIRLVLIGVIGGSIPFYLFFTGLSMISAINGAIIHKTLVLWISILAFVFLKEKISKTGWLAIVSLFAANLLVGGFNEFQFSKGELFVLLATILWAAENLIAQKVLLQVDPDIVTQARMGVGAIILLALSIVLKPQALLEVVNLSINNWLWIILTTGLLTGYVTTWYRGLKYASATVVSAVLVGSTLVTNILSAIFVSHTLNTQVLIQSVVIISAIAILYKSEVKNSNSSSLSFRT